jgi:hypothetical protein
MGLMITTAQGSPWIQAIKIRSIRKVLVREAVGKLTNTKDSLKLLDLSVKTGKLFETI